MALKLADYIKKLHYSEAKNAGSKGAGRRSTIVFKGPETQWPAAALKPLKPWQKKQLTSGHPMVKADGAQGSLWFVQSQVLEKADHYGYFSPSRFSVARDLVAGPFRQSLAEKNKTITIEYLGDSEEELLGLAVAVGMLSYKFNRIWPKPETTLPSVRWKTGLKKQKAIVKSGLQVASGANLSRFLVDLPPNALNPDTYSQLAKSLFKKAGGIQCQVWDYKRLQKEKMGLHIAVGQASDTKPCMIHIQYRAPGCRKKPIAFVGKGITFDSGGLDIKPGAGMRLMKKDMGGSASVMGLAYWVQQARPAINCDFYLAVAENSIGSNAFRPGDILTAKNGKTVEIHNTDAEGRLVLADVLTVAAAKKPQSLIDLATLTGAIKHGLGGATPGLFSDSDNLAEVLLTHTQKRGETAWRMPLVPSEKSRLQSDVADMVNCTDGFGGAITAAHFLNAFTDGVPWAHFDMYAWTTKASGVYRHSGGTGQLVQSLISFIESQAAQ